MPVEEPKVTPSPLYRELAESLTCLIESGTFREGERIPSIRTMSRQYRVSVNTVREAYWLLETQRLIEGRPQSGYFVRRRPPHVPGSPPVELDYLNPHDVLPCSLREEDPAFFSRKSTQGWNLARAAPDTALLPTKKLNAFLAAVSREEGEAIMDYDTPRGLLELREAVARISLEAGIRLSPEDFVITGGAITAIALVLDVLCRTGDTVAVETPTYSEFLKLLKSRGLRVMEIPTSPEEGMNLEVLDWALDHYEIKAVLSIPSFNNPTGFSMPDDRKRRLVELLSRRSVPLIEDDAYGELSFDDKRPLACKAFDTDGTVIYCSSISKTISPGYRVGWIAGGRWHETITQVKVLSGVMSALPLQKAVARYLNQGSWARHLRSLRRRLADQAAAAIEVVERTFPEGTVVHRPQGGLFLWVTLPPSLNAEELYTRAVPEGIFFRPGVVFSACGKFPTSLRLGTGTWNDDVAQALARVGALARGDR